MDKPTTAGVRLKLARADEHLALLYGKRTMLLDSQRHRVIGYFDPDTSDYIFRMTGPQPTLDWGLIVGEFAHLTRSSLDNLLWQLILARGGTPDGQTEFPIYEYETDRDRKSNTENARRKTRGILPEDFTFIELRQPYHERQHPILLASRKYLSKQDFNSRANKYAAWHPLALLGYLNNVDKHRYIHAVVTAAAIVVPNYVGKLVPVIASKSGPGELYFPENVSISVHGMLTPEIVSGVARYQSFGVGGTEDDPAEVARIVGVVPLPNEWPQMKMQGNPVFEIAIGDWERPITVSDLALVRDAVQQVFDRFAPVID